MAKRRPSQTTRHLSRNEAAVEAGIEAAPRRYKEWIDRELVREPEISYRAMGIAVRLLSNAPGFRMTSEDLANESISREGRDAVRTALRELEKAGYLSRTRSRLPNGQCVTKVFITDERPTHQSKSSSSAKPGKASSAPKPRKPSPAPRTGNPSPAPTPEKPTPGFPNPGRSGAKSSNNSTRKSTKGKSTTTTPSTPPVRDELVWPTQLSPQEGVVVGQLIAGLNHDQQQQLLDELQGAYDEGRPPKRIAGWIRALAARTGRGEFIPDLGLQVAKSRSKRNAASAEAAIRRDQAERVSRRNSDPQELKRRLAKLAKIKEEF
jgi:hypothetical protein